MALILSCLCDDPASARAIVDRLRAAGWSAADIAVLHPGETLPPVVTTEETGAEGAAVGAGPAAVAAGAFGWLVGYGVLALPAALVGATIGGVAGATVGAGAEEVVALRKSVLAHYRPHITGSRSALLVTADDARGYDLVMRTFRAHHAKDINVVGRGRLERGADHGA